MSTNNSSVVVIIAAYNAAGTIARAVRSALTEPEVGEVVVVDDASTDNTVTAARTADDGSGRIKILTQPNNTGPSAARNRAIRESTLPWIGILDADDFFLQGRIDGLLAFADKADLIADDAGRVTEDAVGAPRESLLDGAFAKPELISFSQFVSFNITGKKQRGELGFIKPLMRRSFLDTHNIRYQEHMRLGEDYELYARALALGARLYIVPKEGYVSIMRPSSLSGHHSETDLLHFRDCDDNLSALPSLKIEDKKSLRRHYLSVDCRLQWRLLIKAVKERNLPAIMAAFIRPWPVPIYLCSQLKKEMLLRLCKIFKKLKNV
jgi:succinoglycan biosynthesis protein ExoU